VLVQYLLLLGVCPSVYLPQAGIVSKRLHRSSWFWHGGFFPPILHCVIRKFGQSGTSKIHDTSLWNFVANCVDCVVNTTCPRLMHLYNMLITISHVCSTHPFNGPLSGTTQVSRYHSVFTGRMPFLPPNQQRRSTEGKSRVQQLTRFRLRYRVMQSICYSRVSCYRLS